MDSVQWAGELAGNQEESLRALVEVRSGHPTPSFSPPDLPYHHNALTHFSPICRSIRASKWIPSVFRKEIQMGEDSEGSLLM